MTRNLDFNVSARTARLIGLENFANAEGAIVELVKNAYDADSSTCFVVFDLDSPIGNSWLLSSRKSHVGSSPYCYRC